jgi:NtrC-family two-component system response regulator AlgB
MQPPNLDLKALRILVIDDEENIRFALSVCLESDGNKVVAAGTIEAALEETARQAFDLIFLDLRLGTQNGLDYIQQLLQDNPWARIVVITAYASIETAVEAIKLGASDYLSKPFEPAQLRHITRMVAERRMLERQVQALQKTLDDLDPQAGFISASPRYGQTIELAQRLATTHAAVLLRGEPGSGRGWLARSIHQWSLRAQGPFVSMSFLGKSVEQIELELFGRIGDANSAENEIGAIAFCHGGTLLLEEVHQLPAALQPRLASVLRDREFERKDQSVGRPADVRIIASSSVDLAMEVTAGKFRQDLLMALSVAEIEVPALRERSEDIVLLAQRYLAHFSREHHRKIEGFSNDSIFVLRSSLWPGNVRELRNVIERAVLLCETQTIELDHLPVDLINAAARNRVSANAGYQVGDMVALDLIEHSHILKVVAASKTLRRAATILGVNYSALSRKLTRLGAGSGDDKPAQ